MHNGKYEPLKKHLLTKKTSILPMTFSEVEKVIGARLPKSAKLYRTWWSNDAAHHVQANAWLDAGYRTERVDMDLSRLVFVRDRSPRGVAESRNKLKSGQRKSGPHPMIGALKGTFTIEPGYDLTQPAMPEWADMLDEKYGPEKKR